MVKEAIYGKAVLSFQIEYKSTFSEEELDEALVQLDSGIELDDLTLADKEARLSKRVYKMNVIC
ncbi:hypothetical protein P4V58_11560 [Bacillus wiedmannii]|uniref:hypothetical protein n=1 Tax=Bacillus wiedmannii TaxID=1890302 RepID=UPI002E1BE3EE|nr:hypothetical protein [Bacillus wiedmannii]